MPYSEGYVLKTDKITSQLELLLEFFNKNIIGITGTKGKSTTSTLIYEIFKNQGYNTYLLGNIGNPMFDDIEKFRNYIYDLRGEKESLPKYAIGTFDNGTVN